MQPDEPYVSIWLPGTPRGWGRPRARLVQPRFKRAFIHFFNDPLDEKFKSALKGEAVLAMRGREALDEPVSIAVDVFLAPPASWSMAKRDRALQGVVCPTGKPDADNYLKMIDACNGVVWKDDSQVIRAVVGKTYAEFEGYRLNVWRWLL